VKTGAERFGGVLEGAHAVIPLPLSAPLQIYLRKHGPSHSSGRLFRHRIQVWLGRGGMVMAAVRGVN
jgi:hypothetical protein